MQPPTGRSLISEVYLNLIYHLDNMYIHLHKSAQKHAITEPQLKALAHNGIRRLRVVYLIPIKLCSWYPHYLVCIFNIVELFCKRVTLGVYYKG
jgi:hypothetical protein